MVECTCHLLPAQHGPCEACDRAAGEKLAQQALRNTPSTDLRPGKWQEVLADVECDALIVDAPYSDRTHASHSARTEILDNNCERDRKWAASGGKRSTIDYAAFDEVDVIEFVRSWAPRTRGWFVTITDHVLAPIWSLALEEQGRYVFSPLACVDSGSRVRLAGDGPSQWSVWAIVARPRTMAKWGTLPGAYVVPAGQRGGASGDRKIVTGGKPLWLMQALVRDYSRAGDLICDPCAGGGTTLLAAAIEGRRAVGAECLPEHFELAHKRLARGYTPTLFG